MIYKDLESINCPLCSNIGKKFYHDKLHLFYRCNSCYSTFREKSNYPDIETEKNRYLEHKNDVYDSGYRKFVEPIVNSIINNHKQTDDGLDFGAGTGPVISQMLKEKGYHINQYDPFFHNYPKLLEIKYNYVVCREVIEHFHNPYKEFKLLNDLLLPGGRLYCMTDFYHDDLDFEKWYYKNDPTHVFIYNFKALEWIKQNFKFSQLVVNRRLVIYTKN